MPSTRYKMTTFQKKLWIGLLVMAILSPLGIFLPHFFGAEGAWGEWSSEKLGEMIGFVPAGLEKLADIWEAPISGYNLGGDGASIWIRAAWYIISGIIGILIVGCIAYALARVLRRNER
jgi:cobalt/nickel transport protein